MKFNSEWSSTARPIFRIFSLVLSILFLPIGILVIIDKVSSTTIEFDHTFKFGIAAICWGIITLIIAIKGRIFKKNKLEGKIDNEKEKE